MGLIKYIACIILQDSYSKNTEAKHQTTAPLPNISLQLTVFMLYSAHSDFYESSAVMLEEEGAVIVGLLVGLNVIDANLCVKGEDLDTQVRGQGTRIELAVLSEVISEK